MDGPGFFLGIVGQRALSKVIHRLILPNEFAKWGVASLNGFSNKSVKSAYSRIV